MSAIVRESSRRTARLQFGLRGLFLATTICGVWLGAYLHRAREQRKAAQAIVAQGGEVFYDVHKFGDSNERPRWPGWLSRFLGEDEDFFRQVVEVKLDEHADDATFAQVAKLTNLESLDMLFGASRVTDLGTAKLGGLRRLSSIVLTDSQVTDESLRAIGKLPAHRALHLRGARLSDVGLAYLQGSVRLKSLVVDGETVGITDAGMMPLGGLLELENLFLDDANVSPEGLEYLGRLVKLKALHLSNNLRIGDEGLRRIARLTALEELVLSNTNVTSKGLKHLERLKSLQTLDLAGNRGVTDEGLASVAKLVSLEQLNLHGTTVTASGVQRLTRLKKLRKLDLSENGQITADVMMHLAMLPALGMLDLHNTRAAGKGAATTENVARLRRLTGLRLLDLSGTGADTRRLNALPNFRVIGSRPINEPKMPRLGNGVAYRDICQEVVAIAHFGPPDKQYMNLLARLRSDRVLTDLGGGRSEYVEIGSRRLRQTLLDGALTRMLALTEVADVEPGFAQQRPLVEAFVRRLHALPHANGRGPATGFSELLAAAESNIMLRRLYAAASDLEFADVLYAHIQYLDDVNKRWALTDVEREEYEQAPGLLRVCLDDASAQFGPAESLSDDPSPEITVIWQQTRAQPKKSPYASCWEN